MRDIEAIVRSIFTNTFKESLNCALHLWPPLTIVSIMLGASQIKSQVKPKGKVSGTKNFQPNEDLNITLAYKDVTLDAAVGTDQDGNAYYSRICEKFAQLMGDKLIQERSQDAIKNRWLNMIQKALLKFSACMNKAISEYHSGWQMDNYMSLAKQNFQKETGKPFAHELCWLEVKQLPKFCLNTDDMTVQMKKALQLDDDEETKDDTEDEGSAAKEDKIPGSNTSKRSLKMTPRPEMGKKAAKCHKNEAARQMNEERKAAFYKRLADSNEQRTAVQKDRLTLSVFALNSQSEEAQRYIKIKQQEALIDAELNLARKKRELQLLTAANASEDLSQVFPAYTKSSSEHPKDGDNDGEEFSQIF
jgi:hypothetical protein